MLKKRNLCTMVSEHREYQVQELPVERMNCVGKNLEQTSPNEGTVPSGFCTVAVVTALAALAVPALAELAVPTATTARNDSQLGENPQRFEGQDDAQFRGGTVLAQ